MVTTPEPELVDAGSDTSPPMVHLEGDYDPRYALCGARLRDPDVILPEETPLDCVVCAELEGVAW